MGVRADPLTGKVPFIAVPGDFRDAYNLFCCISSNPDKPIPCAYKFYKNNGTAESFLEFVKLMIEYGFLRHNEVLIMDNARIHSGGVAKNIEDLLWETEIDGKPLHIFVVWL